jgi:ubiquinone/menaquinone biosynthesis C-methylase UbiE
MPRSQPTHSPVVTGEKAAWYAKHYYAVEDDIMPTFEKLDTPFLDRKLTPGMLVLDAMCGRGRHAIRYAKRGCVVEANDLNPHMVHHAARLAKAARATIRWHNIDASRLRGIPANRYDAVIAMFSAVGTIPDAARRQDALRAFARVVKPGGIVIVHAHNRWDTFFKPSWWPWVARTYLFPEKGLITGDMVTHYNGLQDMFNHFYSPREFRDAFRAAGLRVLEERYEDYEKRKARTGIARKLFADGFTFVAEKPLKPLTRKARG